MTGPFSRWGDAARRAWAPPVVWHNWVATRTRGERMRIGIAQIETQAGDLERNVERLGECARRAAEKGVELLIFPMAALVGVTPVQSADREGFLLDLMETLAPELEDLACPCLIPMVLSVDGSPLPEALLVEGREIKPVRLSARLSSTKGRDGGDPSVDALPELPFHGARLGVAFTYEDLDAYDDYEYDVDVILFLSGYGFAVDDPSSALGSSLWPRARLAATTRRCSAARALFLPRGASSPPRLPRSRRTCSSMTWTPLPRARFRSLLLRRCTTRRS